MGQGTVSSSQAYKSVSNIKVVLLNGPPRCGKDFIAQQLEWSLMDNIPRYDSVSKEKFAAPLRGALKAFLPAIDIEKDKDTPLVELNGGTPREFQIRLSEEFGKRFYGDAFFGHLCCSRMWMRARGTREGYKHLFIISDCGFLPEAQAVRDFVGAENVVLARIYRDGCSFHGDSRSYVNLPDVMNAEVSNNGSIRTATLHIQFLMSKAWDT